MRDGEVDHRALKHHHLTVEELKGALRGAHGTEDFLKVQAAFLGTDGKISFVLRGN